VKINIALSSSVWARLVIQ